MGLLLSCDILTSLWNKIFWGGSNFFFKGSFSPSKNCISYMVLEQQQAYLTGWDSMCAFIPGTKLAYITLAGNARLSPSAAWLLEIPSLLHVFHSLWSKALEHQFTMTAALLVSSISLCYSEKLSPGYLWNSLGSDLQRNTENPQRTQFTQLRER